MANYKPLLQQYLTKDTAGIVLSYLTPLPYLDEVRSIAGDFRARVDYWEREWAYGGIPTHSYNDYVRCNVCWWKMDYQVNLWNVKTRGNAAKQITSTTTNHC